MSTYTLEIDTDVRPEDLIALAAQRPGFRRAAAGEVEDAGRSVALGPGLWVVATSADVESADLTEGTLGFRPTASVSFVENGRGVPDETRYEAMVAAAASLLGTVAGDAALEFECSIVLLVRRNGHLTINTKWDNDQWSDATAGRGLLRRSIPLASIAALADL